MARLIIVCSCVLATFLVILPGVAVAAPPDRHCSRVTVPVSLAPGQPSTEHIEGRLCVPADRESPVVQVLVHGITYDGSYWEFPDPTNGTDRYNYAAHAQEAGYATLAIDRVGSGKSSHPLSAKLTVDSDAYTVHQVIQAIRQGRLTQPNGKRFDRIIYVGHSYGSLIGWTEADTYHDVDAAVFAAGFSKSAVSAWVELASFYPASLDPRFASAHLDPGYLTTRPGTRYADFYAPMHVDPVVVEHDEATKSTVTVSEIDTMPVILAKHHDIRVPVLLVAGARDRLFCRESLPEAGIGGLPAEGQVLPATGSLTGIRYGATNCDSPAALIADEKPHLGERVPKLDAFILPGAGHDLNQAENASEYFTAVNRWIKSVVEPAGRPLG